jgi:hypothetical protein
MKTAGIVILILGIIIGIYALGIDTSYLIFSGILLILGVVFIILSNGKGENSEMLKFKNNIELAKKAEYKGEIIDAIDKYLDALYYLENDKNSLSKKENESRLKLISTLKIKVEKLKAKQ